MEEKKLTLQILKKTLTIHRFPAGHEIPGQIAESQFYSITKTGDELSIVCDSSIPLNSGYYETGWSCIKVIGPLDFGLTGILSGISTVLAKAGISIFALSTFDTDYILVKSGNLPRAREALLSAGYIMK